MASVHDLTRLLISSWILSDPQDQEIPTANGQLDSALFEAKNHDAFPEWAREMLHFVNDRFGLECLELDDVLDAAQAAGFTSVPNPTYRRAVIETKPDVAKVLAARIGLSVEDAKKIGAVLRDAARKPASATP